MAEQRTTGDILGLLQQHDSPDNSPLFALVYDPDEPSGETRVAVTDVRLEVYSDGAACMVFDTDVPSSRP